MPKVQLVRPLSMPPGAQATTRWTAEPVDESVPV